MPAPTFVASYASAYNTTTSPKSVSVTTLAGDIVVIFSNQTAETGFSSVTSANGISLTNFATYAPAFGEMGLDAWRGVDASGGTNWTLQLTNTDAVHWGFTCYVFRDSNGAGSSNMINGSGAYTVGLTTTEANSAVVVYRPEIFTAYTAEAWVSVNGITPTVGNSLVRVQDSTGNDLVMSAYYNDTGSVGLKTYGITSSSVNHAVVVALEIKGTASQSFATTSWWAA